MTRAARALGMRKLLCLLALCLAIAAVASLATRRFEWMSFLAASLALIALVETDLPLNRRITWRTAFDRLVKERHPVTWVGRLCGLAATFLFLAYFVAIVVAGGD